MVLLASACIVLSIYNTVEANRRFSSKDHGWGAFALFVAFFAMNAGVGGLIALLA